ANSCSQFFVSVFLLLLHTGAHAGECLYLKWDDVDLAEGYIRFRGKRKSLATRSIEIHPRLRLALERLPHRDAEVCRRPDGKPYAKKGNAGSSIKNAFKAACQRAGLPGVTVQNLRTTAAVYHFALHRDRDALMYAFGWRNERSVNFLKLVSTAELDSLAEELRVWRQPVFPAETARQAASQGSTQMPSKDKALPDFRPWPAARLLTREEAARYCGVGLETFLAVCPVLPLSLGQSKRLERYDVRRLDEWIDKLGDPGASSGQSWIGLVEESHARRSR
ncbi:tyrosine-type recombinase/integrase, partial [Rhodoblastus sp.]|uniref:tyrosine-type recombinase/integrase n=1 Tax=Rhodoblastus sp. TaxID=1962975 RepID=UPI0026181764